jgi:hypothetical protein
MVKQASGVSKTNGKASQNISKTHKENHSESADDCPLTPHTIFPVY